MSIFLESGNPRLNSLGNNEKGSYSQEKQSRGLSFSPDTSISKPLTYLPSYKAATSVKKKNQYYDIFKPIKNQKLEFPNRKLQYSVERRTEKSQHEKNGKNWKGGIDRSNNASPFRNEEEKQETNKRVPFGFKAPASSFKEQQDVPNEQEDTFRKHRPSNSFDRRNDEKIFTPKRNFPVTGNAAYYLNSKLFSQTPSISQLNSKKMDKIFDNSTQIKEQVALKFPIKPTEKTSPGPVSFAQPKNVAETAKIKEDPIKTPEKASKFQEDPLVLKEEEEGDIKTKKTPEIKRRSITPTVDEKRDKTYDLPLRPASILKSPSEKKKSLQIDTLQASEKEKQPDPQKQSDIAPNMEVPSKVTQKNEESLANSQDEKIQGNGINERKGSGDKNPEQERIDTEEPLSGLRDSSKNQTEESKYPLESKDSGQSGANSKVFYKDAALKESGSFPVNSNSDRSRSDRMLNSMDLRLQQQQEEYTPVLPHSHTSEIRKEKNFAGSSEKNLKDNDDQVVGRNKSRTVCSKNLFSKKEETVNDDGEIEEIDPKSLEKLMSTLESFNETFKVF